MSYFLGIDLGTTYTAAAVHEGAAQRGPEMVTLGERGPTAPSVLWLQPDGRFVAGDAAERHAMTDPRRVARQFKRRLGDPTPLLVGEASIPAEVLTGQLLAWVIDTTVHARGGERPATVVLTHPANWGPYKRDLLEKAAEIAGVPGVHLVTEPQAAAISYAAQERVEQGAVVAVYDLGGGTFDAAVLRKEADGGFTVLGSPEGIERLGGIDVDAAVFSHVCAAVDNAQEDLDPDDPQALAAVARLREECTVAKESLSLDSETRVPVLLPNVQTEVRVTRGELEALVRPTLAETVTALERALRSAGLQPDAVDHVLLVGGSSRIPLVAELVSSGLGRPVAVDAHPKHAIALGAAIVAARAGGALRPERPLPPPPGAVAGAAGAGAAAAAAAARPAPPGAPAAPPAGRSGAPLPPPPGSGSSPAGAAAPPPPSAPPPSRPAPPAGGPPTDPGFAEASTATGGYRDTPPPPGGLRGTPPPPPGAPAAGAGAYRNVAAMPPPPGQSNELPPGYLTGEAKQKRERSDRRKRILTIVGGVLVLLVALLVTVALTAKGNEGQTVADLDVGDCFNGEVNDLDTVDCADAHAGELFAVAAATDASIPYPGEEQARLDGGNVCAVELGTYYGADTATATANGVELNPVAPTQEQWDAGETDTYCLAVPAEGGSMQGSIKDQGAAG